MRWIANASYRLITFSVAMPVLKIPLAVALHLQDFAVLAMTWTFEQNGACTACVPGKFGPVRNATACVKLHSWKSIGQHWVKLVIHGLPSRKF